MDIRLIYMYGVMECTVWLRPDWGGKPRSRIEMENTQVALGRGIARKHSPDLSRYWRGDVFFAKLRSIHLVGHLVERTSWQKRGL